MEGEKYHIDPLTREPFPLVEKVEHGIKPGPRGEQIVYVKKGDKTEEHKVIDLDQKPSKNPPSEEQDERRRDAKAEKGKQRRIRAERRARPNFYI